MTKTQIEQLMTRDVDDVSEAAVHHPAKELRVTLKNAAALLAREERNNDIEARLFVFKLLRFVQAVLAGAAAPVSAQVARDVIASVQMVLNRHQASDVKRAVRDVVSLLIAKTSARPLTKNRDLSESELIALLALDKGIPSGKPFFFRRFGALKSTFARHAETAKSATRRTKTVPAPKRLLPR